MKNLIAASFFLFFSLSLFSQMNTPNSSYRGRYQSRKDEYMAKSIRKQRAGVIFLSIGAVATAGGIIVITDGSRKYHDYNQNGNYYNGTYNDGSLEIVAGAALTVVGVGLMCGSIPFFVGAHRSRMKAMALSLKTERATLVYKTAFSRQSFPALSLSIPLGR